jgi:hypothetical protein
MIRTFITNVVALFAEWWAHRRYKRAFYGLKVSPESVAKWSVE